MKVIKPKTMAATGSFARASSGTFFGSNGLLQTAATNVLRLQYNPITLAFNGLLIETASTNLILQSETFDNASWTKTNASATANSFNAPTGTLLADTITATAANGTFAQSFTSVNATVYTWSCFVRAGTSNTVRINCLATTSVFLVEFNLSTVTTTTVSGTGTARITAVGNGWFRCEATATATGAGTGAFQIIVPTNGQTAFLYGAQLEARSSASSYITTVGTTVTRSADVISGSDTGLVYSNSVEANPAWSSATTYAKDALVDYQEHIYQSLVNNNTNNIPSVVGSTFWTQIGPDNRHSMFDGQISTLTTSSTPLIVVLATGIINSTALLGLSGNSVTVHVTDGASSPVVYSRTTGLDGTILDDWYMYFFEPFVQKGEVVLTDLPPYNSGYLVMILSGASTVSIGELMVGTVYALGDYALEQGASIGIIDYSRKDTDPDTGKTTFVERAFSKRMSGQFLIENGSLNGVQRILSDIRAVPSVFIGSEADEYSPLLVYGFYRDFSIDIAYPTKSFCRLEVEGLI
jgi:hypothetical protein